MSEATEKKIERPIPEFLAGGGELGELIRQHDWSVTPMGPVDNWPQNLRTCIRIMLTSRQPIWIGWGKELIKFYNDPYLSIIGGKHPWALGKPASVVWKDIWRDIEPMLKTVMEKDEGTYVESQLLIMERNGYPEETYYTFSYTPIPGDKGETAGMICANTDDTDRIISERQLRTLSQLGKNLNDCQSNEEIIANTIATLSENPHDFPFALFYSPTDYHQLSLANHSPLGEFEKDVPKNIDLQANNEITELIKEAAQQKQLQVFEQLRSKIGEMPGGAWEVSPDAAIIIPILQTNAISPYGFLVVGLNPYRLLTEEYRSFFTLVSDQVAKSFAKLHALEEERKRVEALAEIDRAKTTFFSNISHEFRTPLTLLIGPVFDSLQENELNSKNKERLEVVYRNALRMQKLVNTLLDFSKIEAGRLQARFSKVDICKLTTDLASTFRSAIEKAGMTLNIVCEDIADDIYVDIDMWEKIVLNLISNAFKYSKKGEIVVSIKQRLNRLMFSVADNGVGIDADQLEKIFDRFHRIDNINGRSEEGTGIGLSLVRELVRLHSGNISVKSDRGTGSTFTVSFPTGHNHFEHGSVVNGNYEDLRMNNTAAFVEESLKWLPDDNSITETNNEGEIDKSKNTIVLADDNADMRNYVKRLLSPQFNVVSTSNGNDAFEKIKAIQPDLVLSDIMMPGMNGFQLLDKMRQTEEVKNVPVIFLSARAGEEAKVEGLEAGADDYLVKPFTAKELLARVEGNIRIAISRKTAEENLRSIIAQAPVSMSIFKGNDFETEIINEAALQFTNRRIEDVLHKPFHEVYPELADLLIPVLQSVYNTGVTYAANELPLNFLRHGALETSYMNLVMQPLKNEEGKIEGIIAAGVDVTEQITSIKTLEKKQRELNEMANAMPQLVWIAEPSGEVIYYNDRVDEFAGAKKLPDGNWSWEGLVHDDDLAITSQAWETAVTQGTIYQVEHRVRMKDGSFKWHLSRGIPHRDEQGNIIKWFGTATDIQMSRQYAEELELQVRQRTFELQDLNKSLQQSNDDLQQFAHVASHDLKEPLRKIKTFAGRLAEDDSSRISDRSSGFIQKINSATDRMYAMIEGVLRYSTVNTGDDLFECIELADILRQVTSDLEISIQEKNAKITIGDLPVIEGIPVLIHQLFYNLLNNALKFSSTERRPEITISAVIIVKEKQELATLIVADNGIGFDAHQAERIFDPFARLHSKDKYEGTGLGLALCKKIIQRHNGSITAQSEKQKGSSFIVELPLTQIN